MYIYMIVNFPLSQNPTPPHTKVAGLLLLSSYPPLESPSHDNLKHNDAPLHFSVKTIFSAYIKQISS